MAEAAHKQDDTAAEQAQPDSGQATVTELPRRSRQPRRWIRSLVRFVLMLVIPLVLLYYGANYWRRACAMSPPRTPM